MLLRLILAAALAVALSSPAAAQNLASCKVQTGTPTYTNDQNVPTACDANGNLKIASGTTQSTSVAPSGAASSGITPVTTTGSSLAAKSAPGNLYGYNATAGATAGFVAILNAVAAPSAGAAITPLECSAVSSNGTYRTRQDIPDRYTVGIVLLFTSTCATYTAVTPSVMTAVVQ